VRGSEARSGKGGCQLSRACGIRPTQEQPGETEDSSQGTMAAGELRSPPQRRALQEGEPLSLALQQNEETLTPRQLE